MHETTANLGKVSRKTRVSKLRRLRNVRHRPLQSKASWHSHDAGPVGKLFSRTTRMERRPSRGAPDASEQANVLLRSKCTLKDDVSVNTVGSSVNEVLCKTAGMRGLTTAARPLYGTMVGKSVVSSVTEVLCKTAGMRGLTNATWPWCNGRRDMLANMKELTTASLTQILRLDLMCLCSGEDRASGAQRSASGKQVWSERRRQGHSP